MVVIPHLNFRQTLDTPLPKKVEFKQNNFHLKQNLIPVVSAGTDYEEAKAYGVINFDSGEIISSKNINKRLPIASLTKIMTSAVTLDFVSSEEEFTVSEKAASEEPTKVMLKPGEKYRVEDLLKFALISSANDSAQVLKEGIDNKYGNNTFIHAMNEKAKFLGLKNTHFVNPQGYDNPLHYSTIEDLAVLTHYALENYPLINQIVNENIDDLTNNGSDMRFYLQNWNGLLGVYSGIRGVKIGNTEDARHCTIVLSERDDKKVLVIVLGAPGVLERDLWASQLLDLGFSKLGLTAENITEAQLKAKYSSWKYFN